MKTLCTMLIAGALAASPALAQTPPGAPVAGGYAKGDVNDPEVRQAAHFALRQLGRHARLARIESVSRQVVAGINYRLTLRLTDGRRWDVTVWRRLNGTMQLSEKQKL